jgi:hypothetical protein
LKPEAQETTTLSFEKYKYVPLTPEQVDMLAGDIDRRKVHGTWLMAPGQNPSDCFTLLAALPKSAVERLRRLNMIHAYEYMEKSTGTNQFGQPTFMSCSFLDKADMLRVDKRLKEIRNAIGRTG